MDAGARQQLESELRALHAAGRYEQAAAAAIRGYGPELFGFLMSMNHGTEHADDVFSMWSEQLWLGLPRFSWACSLRTWAYTIARNASISLLRQSQRERRRRAAAPASDVLQQVAQQVRESTLVFLRTEVKNRLRELRDRLPEEDRTLLILRIDRQIEWKDLAQILAGDDVVLAPEVQRREAQRLRKRFQMLKVQLLELARKDGLLGQDE